jgi:hypothetical protein
VNHGGWLEIAPPQGSFSWVCEKDVQTGSTENGRTTLVVQTADAEVRAGAAGQNQPTLRETIKLKPGTKLLARGEKIKVANEKDQWWPVECVPDESRFIPITATQKSAAAGGLPTLPNTGQPSKDPPQWQMADQAQREGRLDDAEKLFADIVRENTAPGKDFELCLRAQNRIREIRLQRRATLTSRPGGNTLIPPQQGIPTFTPPADQMPPRPPFSPAGGARSRPMGTAGNTGWESSGLGWLRRSGFQIDGKQTYALETANGQLRVYVTADTGVNLEMHLNRQVELFGSFEVRGDVRGAQYMRVARVAAAR